MTTTRTKGVFVAKGKFRAVLYYKQEKKHLGTFADYDVAVAALEAAKANPDVYFAKPSKASSVICPFHWYEDTRPSIFLMDKQFNGFGQSAAATKPVDLTPNKTSHITTRAESERTLSIAGRRLMY